MLPAANPADARLQPGALVSRVEDGRGRMAEILRSQTTAVTLMDCRTDGRFTDTPWNLIHKWQLVREAPGAPDRLPEPSENPA